MIILNFLHVAPLAKWSVYQQQHTEFFWRLWILLTGMYAWLIPLGLNARHGTSVGRDSHSLRQVGQCSSSCFWGLRRNIASLLISHLTNTETSTNRLNALWAAVAEHNPWVQVTLCKCQQASRHLPRQTHWKRFWNTATRPPLIINCAD